MRWVADLVYILAGLAYLPVLFYQMLVLKKNRRGWVERFGWVRKFDPNKPRIWVHAVSLGEVNAAPRLINALQSRLRDYEIVLSTTTDTGFARAVELFGRDRVFRFPLDFGLVVSRVLARINPAMIVLVELEVWYNLVHMAKAKGIPVVIVNGRLTARSARRFARLRGAATSMFRSLAWVGAQDETIAARFGQLGTPTDRIEVTSSLKWDSAVVVDRVEGSDELARALGLDTFRPLWVCGSTGPCEETIILNAFRSLVGKDTGMRKEECGRKNEADLPHSEFTIPNSPFPLHPPVLVIVPRKPERFDEVARLIQRAGFTCVRRSEHADDAPTPSPPILHGDPTVVLGDTMGELRKFYSLADVVFVGRSLVAMGGSDPMEVAALGKPMIVGPYMDNFRLPVEALREADAIRVVDSAKSLASQVTAILEDPSLAAGLGSRARDVVIRNQGATERTADGIVRLLM